MNALFDSAALAIVAYAQVDSSGNSTGQNSGVTTTRSSTGRYVVALSTALPQAASRNLIFVQPMTTGSAAPASSVVFDTLDATKEVLFGNGSTAVDTSFVILILRTTIAPPAGAPA